MISGYLPALVLYTTAIMCWMAAGVNAQSVSQLTFTAANPSSEQPPLGPSAVVSSMGRIAIANEADRTIKIFETLALDQVLAEIAYPRHVKKVQEIRITQEGENAGGIVHH